MPAGLLGLSLIPVVAGVVRVARLATDPITTEANARFVNDPLPVVIHIGSVTAFAVLGAFQFTRGRRGQWHRRSGRLLIPAGVIGAASGLWMSVSPNLPAHDNTLLMGFRVSFGLAMAASLLAGARAIRERRYDHHGAWMRRGYAIALGAGTQAFTVGLWTLFRENPEGNARAWLMFAGWFINLGVAEWHNHKAHASAKTKRPHTAQP